MSRLLGTFLKNIMKSKLQRISVSVVENEYQQLKHLSKPGISIGFLIREAIHDFLMNSKNIK